LNIMVRLLLLIALWGISSATRADGVPLKDGRYDGPVVVFSLSKAQKDVIERFRSCHLENYRTMNVYTPYIFSLTASQAHTLKAKTGKAPRYFEVYETYLGHNDAGPHWNLALRFSENQIEVPIDLVLSEKDARRAHNEQGWERKNPCFPKLGG
jgi:hypothetical protein